MINKNPRFFDEVGYTCNKLFGAVMRFFDFLTLITNGFLAVFASFLVEDFFGCGACCNGFCLFELVVVDLLLEIVVWLMGVLPYTGVYGFKEYFAGSKWLVGVGARIGWASENSVMPFPYLLTVLATKRILFRESNFLILSYLRTGRV